MDAVFYPVAEGGGDVARVALMAAALERGQSLAEALDEASKMPEPGWSEQIAPSSLLLRFKLLRNKAHVFLTGARSVPFIEYRGLPAHLAKARAGSASGPSPVRRAPAEEASSQLPVDQGVAGSCGGARPCEDDEAAPYSPRR